MDKLIRDEVFLYLVLTNAEEIIRDIKNRGSLGCGDHTVVEFMISRNMGMAKDPELQKSELQVVQGIVGQDLLEISP